MQPGQWLEHSPLLSWLVVAIGGTYLVRYFAQAPEPLNAINLNIVNLSFLLGWIPAAQNARAVDACRAGRDAGGLGRDPAVSFYAGIAGIITARTSTRLIANAFVGLSSPGSFPGVVAIYSAVLGVFVPSGGSKWVIEAPYVMAAAHGLKVHLGWVVASYDLGEALANLVQPFWMLPSLGPVRAARARRDGLHARRVSHADAARARPRHAIWARRCATLSESGDWIIG